MKHKLILCLGTLLLLCSCGNNVAPKDDSKATVVFETFGGTHIDSQIVDKGNKANNPGNVILSDHTFYGFYTCNGYESGEWGNYFDFEQEPINEDITLYAKLIKNVYHSVEFYSDNLLIKSFSKVDDGAIIEPFIPAEKNDELFVGYVARGETGLFDFDTQIYKDYKFDAKWTIKSNITLDYNGATHGIDKLTYDFGYNQTYRLPRPYKNDATFIGWFNSKNEKIELTGIWRYSIPVSLYAKFKDGVGNFTYFDNGSFLKVSKGNNNLESVYIPEWHNGKLIKEIGENAFANDDVIKSIELSSGLTDIGKRSFYNSVIEILVLPDTLFIIGEEAFAECHFLSEIVFNEGLSYLGLRSFYRCSNIKEITLPSTLLELRGGVFNECGSLKKVRFLRSASQGSITKPNLSNRADFRKNYPGFTMVIPKDSIETYKEMYSTQYVWTDVFKCEDYVISDEDYVNGFYVRNRKLLDYNGTETFLTLPDDIIEVGPSCFYLSNVETLTLGKDTSSIYANAFNSSKLLEITFLTNQKIELQTFNYGGLSYDRAFNNNINVTINYLSYKLSQQSIFNNVHLYVNRVNVTLRCYVNKNLYAEITQLQGEKFDQPTDPSETGKKFAGWYTQDGSSGEWGVKFDFENEEATIDLNLYAKFAETYKMTINYNGAFEHGEEELLLCKGDTYKLYSPHKNDAQFVNYTIDNVEIPLEGIFDFDCNVTVVANYLEASNGLSYEETSQYSINGMSVKKNTFNDEKLIIPEYHNNKMVIETATESFLKTDCLKELVLPKTILVIGARSFRECKSLKYFNIPESCRTVLAGSFYGDNNLEYGILNRSKDDGITQCGNDAVLRNVKNGFVLYVPDNSINAYKSSNWGKNIIPEITIKGLGDLK